MPAACDNESWNCRVYVVVLATLTGMSLCGCTEKPDTRQLKVSAVPATKPVQIAHSPVARSPRQPVRSPAQKLVKKEPKELKEPRPKELKEPRTDPVMVVGLDPPSVGRMLGRPSGARVDAMSVEWTYSASDCSLSIFFYPDVSTGGFKALKYNITGTRAGHDCSDFPMMARNDEPD